MENIKDNYFTIFSAADKEMIHSAMLAYLLNKGDFFYQKLFPVLAKLSNKLEAECEKKINHGRLDVAVMEGDNIVLVIETKFKSQPRLTQLEKYSKRLKQATHKYLLVFNPEDLDVDIQKSEWKTISYQHISTTLKEYLATNDEISKKERLLYKEYIAFLDYYIHYYEAIKQDASILAKLAEENPKDSKFFRQLFLENIAKKLRHSIEGITVSSDKGSANEPLLDIIVPHWNEKYTPFICIQVQYDNLKFYLRWQDASTPARKVKPLDEQTRMAALDYFQKWGWLNGLEHFTSHASGKNRSCYAHIEKFQFAGDINNVVNQIKEFYNKIDNAINDHGKFCSWMLS